MVGEHSAKEVAARVGRERDIDLLDGGVDRGERLLDGTERLGSEHLATLLDDLLELPDHLPVSLSVE